VKLLFITSAYPEDREDARGIFIHRIARELVRQGLEVTVIAPGTPSAPLRSELDGVTVARVTYWMPRQQRLAVGLGGIMPNLRAHPWRIVQVPPLIGALTLKAHRLASTFDVVHAHWVYPAGLVGAVAARRRHVPLVVTSHGGDLNLAQRSRFLRLLSGRVARASDACIAVSQDLVKQFISFGVPPARVSLIPYGVDPVHDPADADRIPDASLSEIRNLPVFRMIYVGSLIPRKSVETLLEAHQELEGRGRRVASVILGGGPEKNHLEQVARERSLRHVRFVQAQPPSMVPRWMSQSDVLVLPSRSEGRPNVILEAMAAGLPVVATDIPGNRELVRAGETGLLFPVGDFRKRADCIEELDQHEEARREMGERGRARIARDGLTTTQIAQTHAALYRRIVEQAPGNKRARMP